MDFKQGGDMKAKRVGDRVRFQCPGCNETHEISDKPGGWTFNGDFEKPTFSPSVLVKVGHYCEGQTQPPNCVNCNSQETDDPWPWPCSICHSFVEDGKIRFLNDCSHDLAGKTVELPEVE